MKNEKFLLQSLHGHTTNSDGSLTHRQVLEACAKNNIGVVAFTDHDTLPDQKQVKELRGLKDFPVKYIFGIEVTSGYPQEIADKNDHLFHIVGLFVDPSNGPLLSLTQEIHELRLRRLSQRVKEFRKLKFAISLEEVLATVNANGIPTALNLVNVLERHKENRLILNKYVGKMASLSVRNRQVAVLYREMMADDRGDKQKYFNIFLRDDSPLKIDLPKEAKPGMVRVVNLIRGAGGLATLAHWSFDRDNVSRKLLEKIAREKRLDGVETVYDLFLYKNVLWKKKFKSDQTYLKSLARRFDLFTSGGVDAHRPEDWELFAADKNYSSATVGMVQKIIKLKNPDLKNSSLGE
ncbi:MAG: PHP domain-containing protein [Patescibacteria group bacterium]|nr:PHP domain-containing protein [Patescibacteria group bacterium]